MCLREVDWLTGIAPQAIKPEISVPAYLLKNHRFFEITPPMY